MGQYQEAADLTASIFIVKTKPGLLLVSVAFVAVIIALLIAAGIYNGPHTTLRGPAYGFQIGMSKAEVFKKYIEITAPRSVNIRSYGADGLATRLIMMDDLTNVAVSAEFQSSDHWKGFRGRYPLRYQEFFFTNNHLVKIDTDVRFYRTP